MEYRPDDDAGVKKIDEASSDEERRNLEAQLIEQSDNSAKETDPKDPDDADGR
jgi:hypothetical protein